MIAFLIERGNPLRTVEMCVSNRKRKQILDTNVNCSQTFVRMLPRLSCRDVDETEAETMQMGIVKLA